MNEMASLKRSGTPTAAKITLSPFVLPQGVTNSCSILMGIAGNLTTGAVVDAVGSYCPVFSLAIFLYLSSWMLWVANMRGDKVALS